MKRVPLAFALLASMAALPITIAYAQSPDQDRLTKPYVPHIVKQREAEEAQRQERLAIEKKYGQAQGPESIVEDCKREVDERDRTSRPSITMTPQMIESQRRFEEERCQTQKRLAATPMPNYAPPPVPDDGRCERLEIKRGLANNINSIPRNQQRSYQVLDLVNGKLVENSEQPKRVGCQYDMTDSTGQTSRVVISMFQSSLGQSMIQMQPYDAWFAENSPMAKAMKGHQQQLFDHFRSLGVQGLPQ